MASAKRLGGGKAVTLDADVFEAKWNEGLVWECARAELAARRQGTASTKTRGQVRGGGAKPWRQKGTGRARAGSIRSPIWVGGGTVFGPKPRHYTLKVNRKARRAALRSSLSLHAGRDSLAVVDAGTFDEPKTSTAAELLGGWGRATPTLVVLGADEATVAKSFRNIERIHVLEADDVGIADIVRAASLVLSEAAIEALTARAKGEKAAVAAATEEAS
jgi:large subunit ribosomal protein L4